MRGGGGVSLGFEGGLWDEDWEDQGLKALGEYDMVEVTSQCEGHSEGLSRELVSQNTS